MSQLKKLAGDTAIYGASSIIGRMLNYILVPYYTEVFLPEEYGVVTEFYAYAAFFNVLYVYGLETAYFRFASADKTNEGGIYNSAVTCILITSVILSGTISLFATPIVEYLRYPGKENFVYWFAAIFAIDAVLAIPFAKLRLENKAKLFAIAKLLNIMLNIGLNLFFITLCPKIYNGSVLPALKPLIEMVYSPNFSVGYVFLSNLLANAALIFILSKELFRLRFNINWSILKPMLKYAYPLLFTGLAYVTNEMLSRWALKYWLPENLYPGYDNLAILGIFGAAYKLSIFMTLGIQAFRYAAEPFFFSKAQDKNSPQLFSNVMHWFIIFGCIVLLSVSINLDVLQYIFGNKDYRTGIDIVPILLLANLFLGIYYNLSVWYKVSDKTYYGTYITFIGAFFTILLNYLLIPTFGYKGSAVVTLLVYLIMTAISYFLGKKHYPIPYKVGRGLIYIVFTLALTYLIMNVDISSLWIATPLHILIIVSYIAVIYWVERPRFIKK